MTDAPAKVESESPVRRAFRNPLMRRLPLLIIAVIGIWLWQTSFGSERQVIWQIPASIGAVERVEIQLHDQDGELVKREAWYFEDKRPGELTQQLKLRSGEYQAQIFVTRDGQTRTVQMPVQVDGDIVVVRVRPPPAAPAP
ncbi:MAG: hypothetical protein WBV82_20855 [Myxococcaceae bacterium]